MAPPLADALTLALPTWVLALPSNKTSGRIGQSRYSRIPEAPKSVQGLESSNGGSHEITKSRG